MFCLDEWTRGHTQGTAKMSLTHQDPCRTGRYMFPGSLPPHLPFLSSLSGLFQNWSSSSCFSTEPDIEVYLTRIQSHSHRNRKARKQCQSPIPWLSTLGLKDTKGFLLCAQRGPCRAKTRAQFSQPITQSSPQCRKPFSHSGQS